jgi:hypothetical protein
LEEEALAAFAMKLVVLEDLKDLIQEFLLL